MKGLAGTDLRETHARPAADCLATGIQVKMITGDHAATAAAIAAEIGLEATDRVLTGHDLDALGDAARPQKPLPPNSAKRRLMANARCQRGLSAL